MKIVLDTDVLYFAFVKRSASMARMVLWIADYHDAVITPYIADELLRKVLEQEPEALEIVVAFLDSAIMTVFQNSPELGVDRPMIDDPKDQAILDAAVFHDADIIISGDKHFRQLTIERPRIMEASQFRAEFMPDNE